MAEAGRTQDEGVDVALGPLRMGLGFGLHSEHFPAPTPTCMHWGGTGGSMGLADPGTGVSFGYAPNNWSLGDVSREDPRLGRLVDALRLLLPTL